MNCFTVVKFLKFQTCIFANFWMSSSAIEMLYDTRVYKFNIDIDIDIDIALSNNFKLTKETPHNSLSWVFKMPRLNL